MLYRKNVNFIQSMVKRFKVMSSNGSNEVMNNPNDPKKLQLYSNAIEEVEN